MHWMYTEEDLASYKIEKGYVDEVDLVEIETDADGEEEEENEEATSKKKKKLAIQRYKGLGEMNPEQLWHTTMNPETRMLKQVTIEDAEKANEIFDVLMGSEVAPRKKFIQTHAKYVTNLDV